MESYLFSMTCRDLLPARKKPLKEETAAGIKCLLSKS